MYIYSSACYNYSLLNTVIFSPKTDTIARIYTQEDKKKDRKAPKAWASITEKRQGDADNGGEADNHPDIDKYMKE